MAAPNSIIRLSLFSLSLNYSFELLFLETERGGFFSVSLIDIEKKKREHFIEEKIPKKKIKRKSDYISFSHNNVTATFILDERIKVVFASPDFVFPGAKKGIKGEMIISPSKRISDAWGNIYCPLTIDGFVYIENEKKVIENVSAAFETAIVSAPFSRSYILNLDDEEEKDTIKKTEDLVKLSFKISPLLFSTTYSKVLDEKIAFIIKEELKKEVK